MLADPRATNALVDDFAAQWLNLRRVSEVVVHPDSYPSFDDSLLDAFKQETELFVASTLREDRSVLDLLRANYTFVNERLARHYGLPGHLRQPLPPGDAAERRSTRRAARERRAAGDHVVSRSDLAGPARQMAAEQHLRLARAAAPARRRHQSGGDQARRRAGLDPRTAGAASAGSRVRELSFRDRSARVRAGELRRDRRVADHRRIGRRGRRQRHDDERREGRGAGGAAGAAARAARAVSPHGDREAAGVRARPAARLLRSAGSEKDRPRRRGQRLPLVVADSGHRAEPDVSDGAAHGDEQESES